jgi:hypothetical protein
MPKPWRHPRYPPSLTVQANWIVTLPTGLLRLRHVTHTPDQGWREAWESWLQPSQSLQAPNCDGRDCCRVGTKPKRRYAGTVLASSPNPASSVTWSSLTSETDRPCLWAGQGCRAYAAPLTSSFGGRLGYRVKNK